MKLRLAPVLVVLALAGMGRWGCKPPPDAPPPTPVAAVTLGIIGDTPYGADQSPPATFEGLLADVAAGGAETVVHLGDIKNGGSRCDDSYYAQIDAAFESIEVPVVYTPGDNEWTDCHRTDAGGYDPLERLSALRQQFFPLSAPGLTSQGGEFLENVRWTAADVVFATLHVVGSANGFAPWTGPLETPENAQRREAEVERRTDAAVAWVDAAFDDAADAEGVVLLMQANMYVPGADNAFREIVERIRDRAVAFGRDVLVVEGDTHQYLEDHPVPEAPLLTRIVVEGETVHEWLRVRIDPTAAQLFSWERGTR